MFDFKESLISRKAFVLHLSCNSREGNRFVMGVVTTVLVYFLLSCKFLGILGIIHNCFGNCSLFFCQL